MELKLTRDTFTNNSTTGKLFINDNYECFTLEDTHREKAGVPVSEWKVASKTAIPVGTYQVVIDWSERFQRNMPHILDVEGFEGVRIHWGNSEADTEGCVLLGTVRSEDWVGNSREAFDAFFIKLSNALNDGESAVIEIA